jgi:hypothetical protein
VVVQKRAVVRVVKRAAKRAERRSNMAKKKPDKWIQKADLDEGALTQKAKNKGMTISQFCAQSNLTSKSKKQCRLAQTFSRMAKRNK